MVQGALARGTAGAAAAHQSVISAAGAQASLATAGGGGAQGTSCGDGGDGVTNARVENDFYPTPPWMVDVLFDRPEVAEAVAVAALRHDDYICLCEPCVGAGHLLRAVQRNIPAPQRWTTNDIDPRHEAGSHEDALAMPWEQLGFDMVITNPPFAVDGDPFASRLLARVLDAKSTPIVALLARLTLLEPTHDRAQLLKRTPPDSMIVLPRWSFRGNGKSDTVTCAWFLWGVELEPRIQIEPFRGAQAGLDLLSAESALKA